MSYYLFLDDIRDPVSVTWVRLPNVDQSDWKIVRDYQEFVSCIMTHGIPKFIAFDHDLADIHYYGNDTTSDRHEDTGYDCAKWLAEYCMDNNFKIPDYVVHSMNPVGSENITRYLENAKKNIG